jgi:hypothetical protein
MVRTLELRKSGQARIWCGELPDTGYEPVETSVHVIPANPEVQSVPRLLALEIVLYAGPRVFYGLLGGEWVPDVSSQMTVCAGISHDRGRSFSNSLAGSCDEVMVGFPSQYKMSLLSGVDIARGELGCRLACGQLLINWGSHGVVGSCNAMFRFIAAALVNLVHSPNLDPSDEELFNMLSGERGFVSHTK